MIWLWILLVICIGGAFWFMWEYANTPDTEDEQGYAHPPKEDL